MCDTHNLNAMHRDRGDRRRTHTYAEYRSHNLRLLVFRICRHPIWPLGDRVRHGRLRVKTYLDRVFAVFVTWGKASIR